ncbi:MAG: uroporphyrinogen decarboxylase family protein [Candidatus Hodarchaeota archaeon]
MSMSPTIVEALKGILYTKGLKFIKLTPGSRAVASMFGKPDYAPSLSAQMHVHSMLVAKADPERFIYTDGRYCTGVQISMQKWYGFEQPMLFPPANYNYEVEALGGKVLKSRVHMPSIDQSDPLIKNPDDIEKVDIQRISEKDSGSNPFVIDCHKAIEEFTGSKGPGIVTAPFSFICGIHSYIRVIRNIRKNPEFIHRLLTWSIDEVLLPFMEFLKKETGIKSFIAPDAWAVVPNTNKMIIEEFVNPYYKYFAKQAKKKKLRVVAAGGGDYCEENPDRFDPELMKYCWHNMAMSYIGKPALIMGMGQTQLWPIDLMREYIEENITKKWRPPIFVGCSASFIRDASPQDIINYVKKIIDNLGREGSMCFSLTQVPIDTPPLNVHTFINAVRIYGKYPIAENLADIEYTPPEYEPYDEWYKKEVAEGKTPDYE